MAEINGSNIRIADRFVDTPRPLKVIVVGAGISGIISTIKLRESIPNLDVTIYEKNNGLGGTWLENKYPGCACDIPAHIYQLSSDSNAAWSQFYATAPEILRYWQRVAEKYDLEKLMRFSHQVVEARWDDSDAKWGVKIENSATGTIFHEQCNVLITAIGILNLWKWPSIPGLESYEGKLMHSAAWDENFNLQDKNVAVIGAGSSGIQIVPNIQPKVKRLDHYVRGKTWIGTPMAAQELEKRGVDTSNFSYKASEIEAWENDPKSYLRYRREVENIVQSGFQVFLKGSSTQESARAYFKDLMAQRLSKRPELLKHILPNFPPFCKRLTPGPGYLEALTEKNVDVIPSTITTITKTGIMTADLNHREVDAIVCATGFNTHFTDRFPTYGLHGAKLFDENQGRPRLSTYLSTMVDGFPNMFMFLGPNSGVGHGNLLMIIERLADYCVRAVSKLQTQNILTIQPRAGAVNSFGEFCNAYFKRTVYSDECSSWYKTDGKVTALWPGSSLHAISALSTTRWEDFDYTYVNGNAMGWLGDGSSERDHNDEADKSYYLTSSALVKDDLPSDEKL